MWDIFLYDASATPHITLVSTTAGGIQQNQGGEGISTISASAISGDGRIVAFSSRSTNLVPDDTNNARHVFVKETYSGDIIRASVSTFGDEGNNHSSSYGYGLRPSLSLDGTWVAFTTSATNLAPETGGMAPNTVIHNNQTGETIGFTTARGEDQPAISGDLHGRFIAFFSQGHLDTRYNSSGVFLHDRNTAPIANECDLPRRTEHRHQDRHPGARCPPGVERNGHAVAGPEPPLRLGSPSSATVTIVSDDQ